MYRLHEFGTALAVHRGMVKLRVKRKRSRREAVDVVEALDDVDLPERFAAVQWARMQTRHLDAELAPVARLRQRDVADVEFHIDMAIIDPVGAVEVQRNRNQATVEYGRPVQPGFKKLQYVLEPDRPAGRCRGVVNSESCNVHVLVAMLELQEQVVRSGKLLHRFPPVFLLCAPVSCAAGLFVQPCKITARPGRRPRRPCAATGPPACPARNGSPR